MEADDRYLAFMGLAPTAPRSGILHITISTDTAAGPAVWAGKDGTTGVTAGATGDKGMRKPCKIRRQGELFRPLVRPLSRLAD